MTTGVYAIINEKTGDRYVGQAVSIEKRWSEHKRTLRANKASSPALQEAWNYFGEESFKFEILDICQQGDLDEREFFHMSKSSELNRTLPMLVTLDINSIIDEIDQENKNFVKLYSKYRVNSISDMRRNLRLLQKLFSEAEAISHFLSEFAIFDNKVENDHILPHHIEQIEDELALAVGGVTVALMRIEEIDV